MLTTSVDGIWVLQVLSGIEVVAPELGLRPHLPSVETAEMALGHPVVEELRAAGVITEGGTVDEAVLEWLTVLSQRDVALVLYAPDSTASVGPDRVLLARFAQWWVALERCGAAVRLSGVGTASSGQSAESLISTQIERFCGKAAPAPIRPVTIDADQLVASVCDQKTLRSFLITQGLGAERVGALLVAADPARSAQVSIVAIQSGLAGVLGRPHVQSGAVTIIDAPYGRLVSEHVTRDGRTWMIVSPGYPTQIASAVQKMLCRLPAEDNWHSYRKVV